MQEHHRSAAAAKQPGDLENNILEVESVRSRALSKQRVHKLLHLLLDNLCTLQKINVQIFVVYMFKHISGRVSMELSKALPSTAPPSSGETQDKKSIWYIGWWPTDTCSCVLSHPGILTGSIFDKILGWSGHVSGSQQGWGNVPGIGSWSYIW